MIVTRMDGSTVDVEMNDAVVAPSVDDAGGWLGFVAAGAGVHQVSGAPPSGSGWRWDFFASAWVRTPTLAEVKAQALVMIDAEAGAARMRYITDTPGQQAVYLRKYQQALAYRDAGYTGTVPPYIAAEAAATDGMAQQAADGIIVIAELWDNVLSPAIEQARIGGKRAVDGAENVAAANAARSATLTALGGI